jgi:hypothetical protein
MNRALLVCLALLVAGCVATPEVATFQPASSEKALIRWQRRGKSLVYDAVCARARDGAVSVRLYKQGPASLGEFRLGSANRFEASGRLAGRGWAGPTAEAPTALSMWVWFLTAYQRAAQPNSPSLQSETIRVAFTKSGNTLKVLSVSNRKNGDVVSAIFN